MNALLLVLLGFLAAANAVPGYVPRGKVVTYNYTVDVKAGIIDPAPYASQFYIRSGLRIQRYEGDPTLTNAYNCWLFDVTHELFNGPVVHYEVPPSSPLPLPGAARVVEKPFLIVFHDDGQLQGIKFLGEETKWSENIKRSIASMLQLDMTRVFQPTPVDTRSFITREDTIHGSCQVAYTVRTTDAIPPVLGRHLTVTKMHEPMTCSNFSYLTFNHLESHPCPIGTEEGMSTASRRVFEITDRGQEIIIDQIIAHGVINYFPWLANAEAHYLLANQTMTFVNMERVSTQEQLWMEKVDSPVQNVTYSKPTTFFFGTGDLDVTDGQHVIDVEMHISKLMEMLEEAAGYLRENHMNVKQPEWKHGQTINRISQMLSFLNSEQLHEVYSRIKNPHVARDESVMNIFLGVVPNVGTTAACYFTRDLVLQRSLPDTTALLMLSTLPMHVKIPTKELLLEMYYLLDLRGSSMDVRKAAILCFATLVHKTYANLPSDDDLTGYLEDFRRRLEKEPTYEMKLACILAIRNVGLKEIVNVLDPIIRGKVNISDNPVSIRVHAIWAIKKVVLDPSPYSYDLLWPILANPKHPVTLRIAAYDVLMNQTPDLRRMMNMYWFMVYERDEHLYNYHVETIKGLATSVTPCLMPVREMARKILRFTRIRQAPGPLSTNFYVDSFDETFGHGEAYRISWIVDQWTGIPFIGSVNFMTTIARKPTDRWGVHCHVNGSTELMRMVSRTAFGAAKKQVTQKDVHTLLVQAAADLPDIKDTTVYITVTWNDNVVMTQRYDRNNIMKILRDWSAWREFLNNANRQTVIFDDHYEMHVPTDCGVPAVLATKTPAVDSWRLHFDVSQEEDLTKVQLTCKYQEWKHGEYVMTLYNPYADTWHSIRRTGTRDVVVPINMTMSYNKDWTNVQITTPRLPMTEYSTVGMLTQAKNYVTVTGDRTGALEASCPRCLHIQNVTGVISGKTFVQDFHSKDTALRVYSGIYNCEGHDTPLSMYDLHKTFSTIGDLMHYKEQMKLFMKFREMVKNNMISSQGTSCSNLNKIEPSTEHPASRVGFTFKMKNENLPTKPLHFFNDMRSNIHGTMDVRSAKYPYDESVRLWDALVNVALTQGRTVNTLRMVLTRTTPDEKNLKICVDGQKEYPKVDTDPLNVIGTKNETTAKVTIVMGKARDKCAREEMDVVINVKGEMSDEEPHHNHHDELYASCHNDRHNPDFETEAGHVPKTVACRTEALMHTTLRKYTTNVTLTKVPPLVETCINLLQDVALSRFFPHVTYLSNRTETGVIKLVTQFSPWTPQMNATVVQPVRSYKLLELPFGDAEWNRFMDNVHFGVSSLAELVNGATKVCTVHPGVTITFDDTVHSVPVPENEKWTLMTGEGVEGHFGVFVKRLEIKRLAVKVVIGEHEMEIIPMGSSVVVTVDGAEVSNPAEGVVIPANDMNTYDMRLTTDFEYWHIDSVRLMLRVHYTVNSVTVILTTDFRGQVTGMCGHMNGLMTPSRMYTLP